MVASCDREASLAKQGLRPSMACIILRLFRWDADTSPYSVGKGGLGKEDRDIGSRAKGDRVESRE